MLRPLAAVLTFAIGVLATAAPSAQSESITALFDRLTRETMQRNPDRAIAASFFAPDDLPDIEYQTTPQTNAQRLAGVELARRGLADLNRYAPASLSADDRLSAEILRWQLQLIVDADKYADFIFPFEQFGGLNVNIVARLTIDHPMRTERNAETYLARLGQVALRMDEALAVARERAAKNMMPPRFILNATIAQMTQFISGPVADNPFVAIYASRLDQIATLTPARRQTLRRQAEDLVRQQVVPSWQRVIDMLTALVPRSTDEAGLSRLPGGADAYAFALRRFTSTDYTADQIHEIGLRQVSRIEGEMDAILKSMGRTQGSVKDRVEQLKKEQAYPLTEEGRVEIMAEADRILRDAERRAAALFDHRPKAPVVAQPFPKFREANAAANYTAPPPDGSRPGVIQVPLRPERMTKFSLRTLMYHEGIPGHHFQIALQVENTKLPRFRQIRAFGGNAALTEGWGLYAERLAAEEGWYSDDPIGRLGQLDAELFRARRLVVDTGLHTRKWTRQQAIDYGIEASEIERYVVNPGQACAYMVGQLKLIELRDNARRILGSRFSFKAYHNAVLALGDLPLSILEREVTAYVREP